MQYFCLSCLVFVSSTVVFSTTNVFDDDDDDDDGNVCFYCQSVELGISAEQPNWVYSVRDIYGTGEELKWNTTIHSEVCTWTDRIASRI